MVGMKLDLARNRGSDLFFWKKVITFAPVNEIEDEGPLSFFIKDPSAKPQDDRLVIRMTD